MRAQKVAVAAAYEAAALYALTNSLKGGCTALRHSNN